MTGRNWHLYEARIKAALERVDRRWRLVTLLPRGHPTVNRGYRKTGRLHRLSGFVGNIFSMNLKFLSVFVCIFFLLFRLSK